MNVKDNTILITGGGSGIGRGLAEAFHHLGNQVIIAGRRQNKLDEVTQDNPGMKGIVLDIADAASIADAVGRLARDFPNLNVVIHNAGIMKPEDLSEGADNLHDAEAMITTNLLGPMRLSAAALPLLSKQTRSTIITVSSGLAFVPLAMTPTYCATKAAIHSYTESLRWQLQKSTTEVIEIIPPYVATELMGAGQANDPRAMPLEDFIAEVMHILTTQSAVAEVCVERVNPLRRAAENRNYDLIFKNLNESMSSPH